MAETGYVVAGYLLTGGVLAGAALRLHWRARAAVAALSAPAPRGRRTGPAGRAGWGGRRQLTVRQR